MSLTPGDQERLKETRENAERATQNVLDVISDTVAEGTTALRQRAECLENTISKYPDTRDFLRERGLEHICELDNEGMRELTIYLEKALEEAQQQNRRD